MIVLPGNIVAVENIKKHLTNEEILQRKSAEQMLKRRKVSLKIPAAIEGNEEAKSYWKLIIKRVKGISLLDDLDTDMLAAYCRQSAERDRMIKTYEQALASPEVGKDPIIAMAMMTNAGDLYRLIQSQERVILAYANKLGLTPESRVRLAKKKAEERPVEKDTMFGD